MFYFLHISKCAGTSFIGLARKNVSLFRPDATGNPLNPLTGERISYWLWNASEQGYFLSSPHWQLIANEKQLGQETLFFEGVTYMTILRDPIDRLFSQYQFKIGKPYRSLPLEERGHKFAHFLTREGVDWWQNTLIANLTYRGKRHALKDRLEKAKERLGQFDHVFLMDNLSADIAVLAQYGWRHVELPWKNAGTPGERKWSAARQALQPYPEILKQFLRANEADLELYAYACELAERRKTELPQLRRIPRAPQRIVPNSRNFEFLVISAYDAFLGGYQRAAIEILNRAEELPEAKRCDYCGMSFAEFGLRAFNQPKRAYRERRALQEENWQGRKTAATDEAAKRETPQT